MLISKQTLELVETVVSLLVTIFIRVLLEKRVNPEI